MCSQVRHLYSYSYFFVRIILITIVVMSFFDDYNNRISGTGTSQAHCYYNQSLYA